MTYSELYDNAIKRLETVCRDADDSISIVSQNEAKSNVDLLFYYLLKLDKNELFLRADEEVSEVYINLMEDALGKREMHIPLQHITGVQEFMGLEFDVSEDVLIPRFDTECLVEEAIILARDGDKVLDVCTGSGCVIISLMQYKNGIAGYASDISEKALDVAKSNAGKHDKDITFIQSNMFDDIDETGFDMILCNPPYIKTADIDSLMDEVKLHDPIGALDGGEDGLVYINLLISGAKEHLALHGYLLTEIGFDQGSAVEALFNDSGYTDVRVIKDLAGNDRVVVGRK